MAEDGLCLLLQPLAGGFSGLQKGLQQQREEQQGIIKGVCNAKQPKLYCAATHLQFLHGALSITG